MAWGLGSEAALDTRTVVYSGNEFLEAQTELVSGGTHGAGRIMTAEETAVGRPHGSNILDSPVLRLGCP